MSAESQTWLHGYNSIPLLGSLPRGTQKENEVEIVCNFDKNMNGKYK
jgi:hypothetical protein